MKNKWITVLACLLLAALPAAAQESDLKSPEPPTDVRPDGGTVSLAVGPDAFGYTAADETEATGPTVSFIDISATGTNSGLVGDDVGSGALPIGFPFDFYGTREVMVRWEPAEMGGTSYAPETRLVDVSAPWYQWFPVDLIAEFAWPGTIVDEHLVEFTLREQSFTEIEERFEADARAAGLTFPKDDPLPTDESGDDE